MRVAAAHALLAALLALLAASARAEDAHGHWHTGRATFYGIDGWSIHKGACGLGYQYKNLGTGWDVAAVADASPEFPGSCGRCYEVRCSPRAAVRDAYGNSYDRSNACIAGAASVVVRTVDACPCVYPGNQYSNSRWCCGDNKATQGTHFDLSVWTFEKLADTSNGMIGVEWRRVPCTHTPEQPTPEGSTPMPPFELPQALGFAATSPYDPPSDVYLQPLVLRFDESGKQQGAVRPMREFDHHTQAPVTTLGAVLRTDSTAAITTAAEAAKGRIPTLMCAPTPAPEAAAGSPLDGCTDVAPPGGYTCPEQKAWGACTEAWLIAGLYCRASCERCTLPEGAPASVPAAHFVSPHLRAAPAESPSAESPSAAAVRVWRLRVRAGSDRGSDAAAARAALVPTPLPPALEDLGSPAAPTLEQLSAGDRFAAASPPPAAEEAFGASRFDAGTASYPPPASERAVASPPPPSPELLTTASAGRFAGAASATPAPEPGAVASPTSRFGPPALPPAQEVLSAGRFAAADPQPPAPELVSESRFAAPSLWPPAPEPNVGSRFAGAGAPAPAPELAASANRFADAPSPAPEPAAPPVPAPESSQVARFAAGAAPPPSTEDCAGAAGTAAASARFASSPDAERAAAGTAPCDDVAPFADFSCAEEKASCGKRWMAGYCRHTCGRCVA